MILHLFLLVNSGLQDGKMTVVLQLHAMPGHTELSSVSPLSPSQRPAPKCSQRPGSILSADASPSSSFLFSSSSISSSSGTYLLFLYDVFMSFIRAVHKHLPFYSFLSQRKQCHLSDYRMVSHELYSPSVPQSVSVERHLGCLCSSTVGKHTFYNFHNSLVSVCGFQVSNDFQVRSYDCAYSLHRPLLCNVGSQLYLTDWILCKKLESMFISN